MDNVAGKQLGMEALFELHCDDLLVALLAVPLCTIFRFLLLRCCVRSVSLYDVYYIVHSHRYGFTDMGFKRETGQVFK